MNGKVILIDPTLCDSCGLCTLACSKAHLGGLAPERSHIRVWSVADGFPAPLTCHHCETPSCARACPTKACRRDIETQRVIIDEGQCIGCRACNVACPFGHAHFDAVAKVSTKCDYCGGDPECVRVCEPGAIRYVHSDESAQHKRRLVATVEAALRSSASKGSR